MSEAETKARIEALEKEVADLRARQQREDEMLSALIGSFELGEASLEAARALQESVRKLNLPEAS